MKISFDFDSTLSESDVELYAKSLIEKGHEVWIVTSRLGNGNEPNPKWNDDLYECADRVGIKRQNIHFCSMSNKSEFLKDKGFLFHLDDDYIELSFIREETDVLPVWKYHGNNWKQQCDDLIRIISIYKQKVMYEF